MSGWRDSPLGDVCELKRGYDLPNLSRREGSVPVISSSGLSGFHDQAKVKAPGVVTGRYGTLGNVYYVNEDFWPLNTSLYVRDFKGNNPRYVAELLRTMNLKQYDGAAAVPGLNRNQLHTVPVRVPDLTMQMAIASIATAFDELIENIRRRVEVLDDMVRAIHREWFIHFRFPGHEETPMTDSDFGPLPEDWEIRTLEDCTILFVDGDWIESKDQGGSDFRLLQVSNIGLGSFRETGAYRYVTQSTFDRLRCTEIQNGDLLVSRMPDPVGRAWLVDFLAERSITVVDVAIARPGELSMGLYLAQVLNSLEQLAHAEAVATGTTRKRISRRVLGGLKIRIPPQDLLNRYLKSTQDNRLLASHLRRQSDQLKKMRDMVLPRLVSGEIDASSLDLEALIAGAPAS